MRRVALKSTLLLFLASSAMACHGRRADPAQAPVSVSADIAAPVSNEPACLAAVAKRWRPSGSDGNFVSSTRDDGDAQVYTVCAISTLEFKPQIDGCTVEVYRKRDCQRTGGHEAGLEHPLLKNDPPSPETRALFACAAREMNSRVYLYDLSMLGNRKLCIVAADGTRECRTLACP